MDAMQVVRRAPFGDNPQVGERGATTHKKILAAALDVFGEHGFHDTRVELIADAAGCSRPAFYQYFSGKEDVFWQLARELGGAMAAHGDELGTVTPDRDGVQWLRTWFDGLIELWVAYAPVFLAFQAATRDQAPLARGSRRISDRLGDALLGSVGAGHPELEVENLAATTVTTFLRTINYWRLGLGQLPRERFVDGTAQTIHRLLHGRIDGVNAGPLTGPPGNREPRFPEPPVRPTDRPLRPRGEKTRRLLLDAGATVLPMRGYHDTRVDDIVEAAGVSHGSFYRYFDNKDALFRVLAADAARRMVELVTTFPEDDDAEARRRWLETWFRSYRENGGVISAWQEIDYDDSEVASFSIRIALVVLDRLSRIISRRGFGDSTVDAIGLLAVIERVPYSVLVLGHLEEPVAIDAAAFIVRRALFGLDDKA
jgi:AcrR family transcriptional regulator